MCKIVCTLLAWSLMCTSQADTNTSLLAVLINLGCEATTTIYTVYMLVCRVSYTKSILRPGRVGRLRKIGYSMTTNNWPAAGNKTKFMYNN